MRRWPAPGSLCEPGYFAAPFRIHADAKLSVSWPRAGTRITQALDSKRRHYLHVALGAVTVGERQLKAGDALLMEGESGLELRAVSDSEVLLFELP